MELEEALRIVTDCGPVALCTPFIGYQHPIWTREFETMIKPVQLYRCSTMRLVIERARIVLTEQALSVPQVKWLFYMDDDVVPENTMALPMLLKHDLPVVSGLYFNRGYPHAPQMYEAAQEPGLRGRYWPIFDWNADEMVEADAVGGGFLLIKREVVEKLMAKPSEWNPVGPYEEDIQARMLKLFQTLRDPQEWAKAMTLLDAEIEHWMRRPGGRLFHWSLTGDKGEDFFFCEKVKAAGYKIMVDTAVRARHMTEVPIGENHWRQVRPMIHKHDPRLAVGTHETDRLKELKEVEDVDSVHPTTSS